MRSLRRCLLLAGLLSVLSVPTAARPETWTEWKVRRFGDLSEAVSTHLDLAARRKRDVKPWTTAHLRVLLSNLMDAAELAQVADDPANVCLEDPEFGVLTAAAMSAANASLLDIAVFNAHAQGHGGEASRVLAERARNERNEAANEVRLAMQLYRRRAAE